MHGSFIVKMISSFLYVRHEIEEPSIKYILLRDRVGLSVEKHMLALGLTTKSTPIQVLRGEVLEGVPEAEQPTDSTRAVVVGIERKSLRLGCPTEDIARLSEEETNLLLAITSSEGRYLAYIDRKHLAFGRQLSIGSAVLVEVKGNFQVLPGTIWYKGVLPPNLGTWFGVELIVSTRALYIMKILFRQQHNFSLVFQLTCSDLLKLISTPRILPSMSSFLEDS